VGRLVLKYTVVRSWTEDVHYHRADSDRCLVFPSTRFLGVRFLSLLTSMACGYLEVGPSEGCPAPCFLGLKSAGGGPLGAIEERLKDRTQALATDAR
jgi:hypothetical protein